MDVSQTELARIFGVTPRTIRDYHGLGLEDHRDAETGSYDLPAAVKWRLKLEWDRALESRDPEEADELLVYRTRKAAADAKLREDELRVRRGELLPAEQVLPLVRRPLEAVSAGLKSARRLHSKAWATKLGVTQAVAMAMIDELVEPIREDLWRVFEEMHAERGDSDSDGS